MNLEVKFNVDIPWIDENENLDDKIASEIRYEFVRTLAKQLVSANYGSGRMFENIHDLVNKAINMAVDQAINDIEDRISRKRKIADIERETIDLQKEIQNCVKKEIKSIDFASLMEQTIAKRFK